MWTRLRRSAEDKQGSEAEEKEWGIFQSGFPSMGLFISFLSHETSLLLQCLIFSVLESVEAAR
ncbi:MAG: hypothetical protein EBS82_03605 [Methylocystaceae bacterium]|nr:hypothetical protein [Methylocystaceae bacterium]NBT96985.1 hypothetical protein [Methylocystaceae bacterium]